LESFLESFPVIFKEGLSAAFILIPFELSGPCRAISNRKQETKIFLISLESFLESFPVIFKGGLFAVFILIPFELRSPCRAIIVPHFAKIKEGTVNIGMVSFLKEILLD
jgi:hypothetical protein